VSVPTLVIHRERDPRVKVAAGRYLAAHIPGAKYVEVPGTDHPIWVGDTDRVIDEIEEFLTGNRPVPIPDRVLATVLSVSIGPRAGLPRSWLDRVVRFRDIAVGLLGQYRGREIGRRPDGTTAMFDGPVRALHCALALREAAEQLDMAVRGGIHTGEVEIAGDEIGGAAVLTAAAITAVARAGEILASTTVRDIVPGSGLVFYDAGDRVPVGGTDIPRLLLLGARATQQTEASIPSAGTRLSRREREILAVVGRGMTNAEIAAALDLSEHTVKRHVANILTKLDLANRSAAAAFAARHGWL
jgi:DNA-binding CsgD family transcriptional regulator